MAPTSVGTICQKARGDVHAYAGLEVGRLHGPDVPVPHSLFTQRVWERQRASPHKHPHEAAQPSAASPDTHRPKPSSGES